MNNSILNDIQKAYNLVKSIGPVPVKIWFVDCRKEYHEFMQLFSEVRKPPDALSPFHTFEGLPVVQWYKSYYDPNSEIISLSGYDLNSLQREFGQDKRIWPWFCAIPGIWVEMSEGKPLRIELANKEPTSEQGE